MLASYYAEFAKTYCSIEMLILTYGTVIHVVSKFGEESVVYLLMANA